MPDVRGGFSIGVDIGGTFTDCAVLTPQGDVLVGKVPTVRSDRAQGFFDSLEAAGAQIGLSISELLTRTDRLSHGTTVGINALLTREGARVGLLATKGHGSAIRIMDNFGRVTGVAIEEVLDYSRSRQPQQFLDRRHIVEITQRMDYAGRVVVALDTAEVEAAARYLVSEEVEAVAVSYLWGFVNPAHELETAALLGTLMDGVFISLAHQTDPRLGEYERTATTVLNSYIGPVMNAYIDDIARGARERGFDGEVLFAHAGGGLVTAAIAGRQPIITLQSGPVGGVVATVAAAALGNDANVIATDMGGTTLDVSVIHNGETAVSDSATVEQHRIRLRKVDVESVGAGGGSIAWIDSETGMLRVGPHSAGAVPGPVCYGRGGTEPTVTDADVVLGILNPNGVLGGGIRLDGGAAREAIGLLASQLGMEIDQCAAGIVAIVDSRMEDLVRRVTLQRGHDPRDFSLWAYGGAAGAHAALYAQGLGVSTVVVPMAELASIWSALGVAAAPLIRTLQASLYLISPFEQQDVDRLEAAFAALERDVLADCEAMGVVPADVVIDRGASLKYALQVFEVETPVAEGAIDLDGLHRIVAEFERGYERRYGTGTGYPEAGFAVTEVRVRATAPLKQLVLSSRRGASASPPDVSHRDVYWQECGRIATPVYVGRTVCPGQRFEGPALIEFSTTTVAIRPGQVAAVDGLGSIRIDLDPQRAPSPSRPESGVARA